MHEEEISTFEALTGADRTNATQYLESCGWNVEEAFNLYSVGHGGDTPSYQHETESIDTDTLSQYESDAAMAAAFADHSPTYSSSRAASKLGGDLKPADKGFGDYDDDGVRAPTEYTTGRLIDDNPFADLGPLLASALGGRDDGLNMMLGGGRRGGGGQFGHLNPPKVVDLPDSDWMFPLPKEAKKLNCGGEIAHARQRAKDEKKWLLVNLQSIDIFDSHRMNRDVWSNDSILSVLESSFVFWQRASTSNQGANFLRLYGISDEVLPITVIIGPTGTQLFSKSGFMKSDELSSSLLEFLDTHDMDSTEAPLIPKRKHSNDVSKNADILGIQDADESEDDALTAAIAMSLNDDALPSQSSITTPPPTSKSIDTDFDEDSYVAPSAHEVLAVASEEEAQEEMSCSHLPPKLPSVGEEPVKGTIGTTRLQLRLADGKTVVRRFYLDDTVAAIYSVVIEKLPEAQTKPFVLQTPIATAFKLLDVAGETIAAQSLANSKILMTWDDE